MRKLAVVMGAFFLAAHTSMLVASERAYETCAVCHGQNAEGNDHLSAPQLAGQVAAYLSEQLVNYRSGARGYHPKDVSGQLMKANAKELSDSEIAELSRYLSQKVSTPVVPSAGDRDRGKKIYDSNCLACHGPDASGVEPLKAPNLRILSAKYIASQLLAYEKGWRGDDKNGTTRSKAMRTVIVQLNGVDDIRDLIAYLHE